MEVIKKKFKLITTTASTEGGYIITPDLTVNYGLNILLSSENKDWGFFDTYEDEDANVSGIDIPTDEYVVTGSSSSRLRELKKFSASNDLAVGYKTSNDQGIDGVDVAQSTGGNIVYYIGGIRYVDTPDGVTNYSFTSQGYNSPNFVNLPIIKDEAKQNIVDKPEVDNNVFIIRQSLPVYENIYRLSSIDSLDQLLNYGGGSKFNVVENT
jgi:hypothetical protein